MKEDSKTNPRNKKSRDLVLVSRRNHRMNREDFSENKNHEITENKNKINSNYNFKLKLKAIRRYIRMKHNN